MSSTPTLLGKEIDARSKPLSSTDGTPASDSGRAESVVFMEEDEPTEWIAQVERGVLITFVSMPQVEIISSEFDSGTTSKPRTLNNGRPIKLGPINLGSPIRSNIFMPNPLYSKKFSYTQHIIFQLTYLDLNH